MDILKLVEALEKTSREIVTYEVNCEFSEAINEAVSLLVEQGERITELEAQTRWIPASEPPKEWKDDENGVAINYLVFCPDLGIDIGNYVKPANMWFCLGVPVPVTHWMPLPEPPK